MSNRDSKKREFWVWDWDERGYFNKVAHNSRMKKRTIHSLRIRTRRST
jgi:hypothetical protein